MCGIAGMVGKRDEVVEAADVHRMCQTIVHRGPDDEGIYARGPVGTRHAPPEHHRSVGRTTAHSQRRQDASGSSSTAKSTTFPNFAANWKARATSSTPTAIPR